MLLFKKNTLTFTQAVALIGGYFYYLIFLIFLKSSERKSTLGFIMPYKKYCLLIFCLFCGTTIFSQNSESPFRVWQLLSWKANMHLRGNYVNSISKTDNVVSRKNSSSSGDGGANLSMRSYIVHPNFMDINCSGVYNTYGNGTSAAGLPDFTEKTINNGFDGGINFLKKQKLHLTTSGGISNGKSNFEKINRVTNKDKYWITSFDFPNNILPISLNYNYTKAEQKIIELNLRNKTELKVFSASTSKSFTRFDNNSIGYHLTDNKFSQNNYDTHSYYSSHYKNSDMNFGNQINFSLDKEKKYQYSSILTAYHSDGSAVVNSLAIGENLNMQLPKNFNWTNGYTFTTGNRDYFKQGVVNVFSQSFRSSLNHQLFKSLSSHLSYSRIVSKHNTLYQIGNNVSLSLAYTKRIPKGSLTLNYIYDQSFHTLKSPATTINIMHEEYFIADSLIILINQQHVNIQTVVIRDIYGVPYTLNIDYILIQRDLYIEIVRLMGGTLQNKSVVFIDYSYEKAGLFKSTGIGNTISAQVQLFGNLLSLFYSFSKQNYYNVTQSDLQILNYFIRHNAGIGINYKFMRGGIFYDYNRSSIMPYQSIRYNIEGHKSYQKLDFTLSGNLSDMQMDKEVERRQNMDFSAQLSYVFFQNIGTSAHYSYATSKGRGQNVDVQSAGINLNGRINMLSISCWTNFYFKRLSNNRSVYNGTYIQLTRYFN